MYKVGQKYYNKSFHYFGIDPHNEGPLLFLGPASKHVGTRNHQDGYKVLQLKTNKEIFVSGILIPEDEALPIMEEEKIERHCSQTKRHLQGMCNEWIESLNVLQKEAIVKSGKLPLTKKYQG